MEKGFRAPALSKFQEMSTHFMVNLLEYGTSCQTWTGFEICNRQLLVYKLQSELSLIPAECFLDLTRGPGVVFLIGVNKYNSAIFIPF